MHDYYLLLGIARNASAQVVKIAFEGKMKALGDPAYAASPDDKREEERLLREAFVTLSVAAKRGPYDAKLAAFEDRGPATADSRPAWLVPAAVAACLALAASALWVNHSRDKERIRLEEERLAMEKESARRKADLEADRLKELTVRREEAAELSRQRAEQARIQRENAEYDRSRRLEESRARQIDASRANQESRALLEKRREEERLRRAEEERLRTARREADRQKDYLRRLELEEERVRAARHERAIREAREREYQQYLEEQRRRQVQR